MGLGSESNSVLRLDHVLGLHFAKLITLAMVRNDGEDKRSSSFQEPAEYRQLLELPPAGSESDHYGRQITLKVNPISRTHAEADAFQQAFDSGIRGGRVRLTLVTLETEGDTHMAIGGGTDKYLVYVTFDNENFSYVVNPAKSNNAETLVVGGQEGIYPEKWCVDLKTTLKAAKSFAEFGTIDKSVVWERDEVAEPA